MGHKRVLGGSFITIITYQSTQVLDILRSGKVYHAYPSRTLDYAYSSLIDMLGLHCQSPIFGYLKYHRHLADGRLSSCAANTEGSKGACEANRISDLGGIYLL